MNNFRNIYVNNEKLMLGEFGHTYEIENDLIDESNKVYYANEFFQKEYTSKTDIWYLFKIDYLNKFIAIHN